MFFFYTRNTVHSFLCLQLESPIYSYLGNQNILIVYVLVNVLNQIYCLIYTILNVKETLQDAGWCCQVNRCLRKKYEKMKKCQAGESLQDKPRSGKPFIISWVPFMVIDKFSENFSSSHNLLSKRILIQGCNSYFRNLTHYCP